MDPICSVSARNLQGLMQARCKEQAQSTRMQDCVTSLRCDPVDCPESVPSVRREWRWIALGWKDGQRFGRLGGARAGRKATWKGSSQWLRAYNGFNVPSGGMQNNSPDRC